MITKNDIVERNSEIAGITPEEAFAEYKCHIEACILLMADKPKRRFSRRFKMRCEGWRLNLGDYFIISKAGLIKSRYFLNLILIHYPTKIWNIVC